MRAGIRPSLSLGQVPRNPPKTILPSGRRRAVTRAGLDTNGRNGRAPRAAAATTPTRSAAAGPDARRASGDQGSVVAATRGYRKRGDPLHRPWEGVDAPPPGAGCPATSCWQFGQNRSRVVPAVPRRSGGGGQNDGHPPAPPGDSTEDLDSDRPPRTCPWLPSPAETRFVVEAGAPVPARGVTRNGSPMSIFLAVRAGHTASSFPAEHAGRARRGGPPPWRARTARMPLRCMGPYPAPGIRSPSVQHRAPKR